MFEQKITLIIITILVANLTSSSSELKFRLHPKDVLGIPLADLFPYGTKMNQASLIKDDKIVQGMIQPPFVKNLARNPQKIPQEITDQLKDIIDTASHKEHVAALIKEAQGGCSAIIFRFDEHNVSILNESFAVPLAEDDFVCKQIALDDGQIYYTAISFGRLYFCKRSYFDLMSKGSCNVLAGDYTLSAEQVRDIQVKIEFLKTEEDNKLFMIYVPISPIAYFQKRFAFIYSDRLQYHEIPVEGFTIGKLALISHRPKEDMVYALALNSQGNRSELFNLNFRNGLLDKEALKLGLLKDYINSFEFCRGKILTSQVVDSKGEEALQISILDVETLTEQFINFPSALALNKARQINQNTIFIELLSKKQKKDLYLLETTTGLLWAWDSQLLNSDWGWMAVTSQIESVLAFIEYKAGNVNTVGLRESSHLHFSFSELAVKDSKTQIQIKVGSKIALDVTINFASFEDTQIDLTTRLFTSAEEPASVRLPVLGNSLAYKSSKIKFFSESSITTQNELFAGCQPVMFASWNTNICLLCKEDKLVFAFTDATKDVQPAQIQPYITRFDLTWFKHEDVIDFVIMQNDILVILISTLELQIVDLKILEREEKVSKSFQRYSELRYMYESCWLKGEAVLCEKAGTISIFEVALQGGSFDLLQRTYVHDIEVQTKSITACSAKKDELIFIKRDPLFNRQDLRNKYSVYRQTPKSLLDLSENIGYDLDDSLQVFEVGLDSVLFCLEQQGQPKFLMIKNRFVLELPTDGFIKDFKDILGVQSLNEEEIVVVVYRTIQGPIRAAVYRSTLDPLSRLIYEFEMLDATCDKGFIGLGKRQQATFDIYFVCGDTFEDAHPFIRAWTLTPSGPYLEVEPLTTSQSITINQNTYKFQFEQPPERIPLSVKARDLELRSKTDADGFAAHLLESEKVFELSGPVRKISLRTQNPDIKLFERATLVKDHRLLDELGKVEMKTPAYISLFRDTYSVSFGDYNLVDRKTEFSYAYGNCQPIDVVWKDGEYDRLFMAPSLCIGLKESGYVLKMAEKTTLTIPTTALETTLLFESRFLIYSKSRLFLILKIQGTGAFAILRLGFDEESQQWTVDASKLLELDLIHPSIISPVSFFAFYNEEVRQIWTVFSSHSDTRFIFARVDPESLTLELTKSQELDFTLQNRPSRVLSATFAFEKGTLFAFVTTEQGLFTVRFEKKTLWTLRTVESYSYSMRRADKPSIVRHNDKFLAVLYYSNQAPYYEELLLFKRAVSEHAQHAFYVIDRRFLTNLNYDILDFALKADEVAGTTTLIIVYLQHGNNVSTDQRELWVKEFDIGEMRLHVRLAAIENTQQLELSLTNFENYSEVHSIALMTSGFDQTTTMLLGLFGLVLVLAGLLLCLRSVYSGNKVIRSQLDENFRQTAPSVLGDTRETRMNV